MRHDTGAAERTGDAHRTGDAEPGRFSIRERTGDAEPGRICLRPPSVQAGLTAPATVNYEAVLAGLPDAVIAVDTDLRIVFWNSAAEVLTER